MAKSLQFGNISMGVQPESPARPAGSQEPFRILVLGDFSGRANRGLLETGRALARRRPRMIDRDNFEDVLSQFDVRLDRTITDSEQRAVSVAIKELDDFHPDRLFGSLSLFSRLKQLRRRLLSNDTFPDAAAEVRSWGAADESAAGAAPAAPPEGHVPPLAGDEMSVENILGRALEETGQVTGSRPGFVDWQRLVAEIVEPYTLPGADPRQGELVACVDAVTARSMSALLHHPEFQSLEKAWRGLYFLVRLLETDASLKVSLIDVSREELAQDLCGCDDLRESGMYQLLVEQTVGTPGGHPWSLLVGSYPFGFWQQDTELLGRMAKIAAAAGSAWLAEADGALVGCTDPGMTPDVDDWDEPRTPDLWTELRSLPEASCLGLAWPGFLLRLPYGNRTSPTQSFAYDETADGWSHGSYLWGNPAMAVGCLMGQAFTQSGWSLQPGEVSEISGIPVHVYEVEGEPHAHPCGELLLNERGVSRVLAQGLMPLLSVQGQDAIRVGSFRAINGEALRGRWS